MTVRLEGPSLAWVSGDSRAALSDCRRDYALAAVPTDRLVIDVPWGGYVQVTVPAREPGADAADLVARDDDGLLVLCGRIYEMRGTVDVPEVARPPQLLLRLSRALGWDRVLERLYGRFAIVQVDRNGWTLIRDHVGEEQLYFSTRGGRLTFSSNLGHVHELAGRPPFVDDLESVRLFETPLGEETQYRDVFRMSQGTLVRATSSGRTIERRVYWSPGEARGEIHDADEAVGMLQSHMRTALRRRLRPGRTGAFLSGGQDSSYVAATAVRLGVAVTKGYSCTWPMLDAVYDESRWSRLVASDAGIAHSLVTPTSEDFERDYPTVMRVLGEVKANAAHFPEFEIARQAAADGIDQLLSGYGADELLAGEVRYLLLVLDRDRDHLATLLDHPLIASYRPLVHKLWEAPAGATPAEKYWRLSVRGPDVGTDHQLFPWFREPFERHRLLLDQLAACDIRVSVPPLLDATQLLKHFGIEKICPFLDRDVHDLAFRLVDDLKVRGLTTKWVLRRASRSLVPDAVTDRTDKVGFAFPHFAAAFAPVVGRWSDELVRRTGRPIQYDPKRGRYDRARIMAASEHLVRLAFDPAYLDTPDRGCS